MEKLGNFLTWADYVIIVGSLFVCTVVGIYHGRSKKKRTTKSDEHQISYFLGGGDMSIFPIAVSILATTISAIPIVSGVSEIYRHGLEYIFVSLGIQAGKILAGYMIVPVFKYIQYVSIYKYLENRFDRCVRQSFSFSYMVMNIMISAVVLYIPSLLLTHVSGFPYWMTASISGIICTVYCAMGGFRTVVYTDVIQCSFMLLSVIVIIARGTILSGGSAAVWKAGIQDGFFAHLTWMDTVDKPFTVISSSILGVFLAFQQLSINQAIVQRILSVKSTKAAQRSLMIATVLGATFSFLVVCTAAVVYTYFKDCDPYQLPEVTGVKKLDLMFMYAVQVFLSDYPGLSGVVLAGVISSSLSTISSYINSFAAITMEDFIKPYCRTLCDKKEIFISKCLTVVFGCITIILSFIIPFLGGILQAVLSVYGAIGGPLTGLMFLAMFVPRANKKACIVGLMFGIAFCIWLTIASPMYRTPSKTLPLSVSKCPGNLTTPLSRSSVNETRNWDEPDIRFSVLNKNKLNDTMDLKQKSRQVFFLYQLSFVWYGPMGLFLTLLVGVLTSYVFRQKDSEINPLLFSPFIQRRLPPVVIHLTPKSGELTTYESENGIGTNGRCNEDYDEKL